MTKKSIGLLGMAVACAAAISISTTGVIDSYVVKSAAAILTKAE